MLRLIKCILIFILVDDFMIFLGSNHSFLKLSSYQHCLSKSSSAAQEHSTTQIIGPLNRPGLPTYLFLPPEFGAAVNWQWVKRCSEHSTAKYTTLAYWFFYAEGTRDSADQGSALWSPSLNLTAGHHISRKNGGPSGPEKAEHWYPCKNGPEHTPTKRTLLFL